MDKLTDLERVQAFFDLLTNHDLPSGWTVPNLPPKMTGDQAFSLIYFLQGYPYDALPDHIERCGGCGDLVDTDAEHMEWIERLENRLCESCYEAESAFRCVGRHREIEAHDIHMGPGHMWVVAEEVEGLDPGLYRVNRWPFYYDGMVCGHVNTGAVERIGEVPDGVDCDGYPTGFLCCGCEHAIAHAQEGEH